MPDRRRRNCRRCQGHDSEVGPISWMGYCFPCGREVYEENIAQLRAHSGPFANAHRTACIKSWGGYTREEMEAARGNAS